MLLRFSFAGDSLNSNTNISKSWKRIKLFFVLLVFLSVTFTLFWYFYFKVAYTPFGYVRSDWVEISPRIDGYIDNVLVKTDTHVKSGDVLMKIYRYPFELKVNQLSAQLEMEKAQLAELRTISEDLAEQMLIQKGVMDLMVIKKARYEKLSNETAVSLEQFQNITMDHDNENLQLSELKAKKNETDKKIIVQEKTIDAQEAELKIAQYNLSQTDIVAPFDGWTTNNYIRPGQFIKTGEAACGFRGDKCWIEMNYKECFVGRIRPGMKAYIQTDLHPLTIMSGKVESITNAVNRDDAPDQVLPYVEPTIDWVRLQYRFTVRIAIEKIPEHVNLRMGANARAWIPLDQ